MRVLSVVGNRPQFIKSAPLSAALEAAGIEEVLLHTGQHYDRELSQLFFEELGLGEPTYRLEVGSLPHDEMIERMRPGILAAIETEKPDWVLVFGDTNSTLAGARVAHDAGVSVAHVEAGLRSGDWSMPEERNRVEVDRLAQLLLCPDERSAKTLASEGAGRSEEHTSELQSPERNPASTWATGTPLSLATRAPARVEFVSPKTSTQSGFSVSIAARIPGRMR